MLSHSTFSNPASDAARHFIECKESPGKGLGVFAKEPIPRGTRILSESALLRLNGDTGTARDVVTAYENLTSLQQKLHFELHVHACDKFKITTEREMEQEWEKIPEL
jgi:hypothetical protein